MIVIIVLLLIVIVLVGACYLLLDQLSKREMKIFALLNEINDLKRELRRKL